jgi:hypothetical protein
LAVGGHVVASSLPIRSLKNLLGPATPAAWPACRVAFHLSIETERRGDEEDEEEKTNRRGKFKRQACTMVPLPQHAHRSLYLPLPFLLLPLLLPHTQSGSVRRGRRHPDVAPTDRRGKLVGCRRASSAQANLLLHTPFTRPSGPSPAKRDSSTRSGLISCMSAACVPPATYNPSRSQGGEPESTAVLFYRDKDGDKMTELGVSLVDCRGSRRQVKRAPSTKHRSRRLGDRINSSQETRRDGQQQWPGPDNGDRAWPSEGPEDPEVEKCGNGRRGELMPVAWPGCVPFVGWSRTERPPGPLPGSRGGHRPFFPVTTESQTWAWDLNGDNPLPTCGFVLVSSSSPTCPLALSAPSLLTLVICIPAAAYGALACSTANTLAHRNRDAPQLARRPMPCRYPCVSHSGPVSRPFFYFPSNFLSFPSFPFALSSVFFQPPRFSLYMKRLQCVPSRTAFGEMQVRHAMCWQIYPKQ